MNRDTIQNEDPIKHGINGWGLEIFTRTEVVVNGHLNVWGDYVYENEKTHETRKVTRLLESRPTLRKDTHEEEFE